MLLNHFGEILCCRDEIAQIDKKYFMKEKSGSDKWHVDDSAMGEINGLLDKIIKYYIELTDKYKIPKVSWTQKLNGPGICPLPNMTNIVQARYADYTAVMPHCGSIGCQQMWEMSNAGLNSRRFDAIQRIVREIGQMIKDTEATTIKKSAPPLTGIKLHEMLINDDRNKRRIAWEKQQKELSSNKFKTPSKKASFITDDIPNTLDLCVKDAILKSDNQVIEDKIISHNNNLTITQPTIVNEENTLSLNEHVLKYHSFDNINLDLSNLIDT